MKRKPLISFVMIVVLLVSIFGTVSADDGVTPDPTPTPVVDRDAKFFTHPVVQLLASYFSQDDEVTPEDPATGTPDPVTGELPVTAQDVLAAEIAAYHEEGMGFGELVKLYAMVQASEEACAEQTADTTCAPLTIDELVTRVQNGEGMGQLFKEYGKPAMLGVGHVKQEMKDKDQQETVDDDQPGNSNGNANGKDKDKAKDKDKTNPGKGPKKDK